LGGFNIYQYTISAAGWIDPLGWMNVTGYTEGGMPRVSAEWRSLYGPSALRDHHLIPQAMMRDAGFMNQLRTAGISDPSDYIHRQIARIPNSQHIDVHDNGWNRQFSNWYRRNPNFTRSELQQQIRTMMKSHNIPKSARNGVGRYGC
jgi:hypothetical protein